MRKAVLILWMAAVVASAGIAEARRAATDADIDEVSVTVAVQTAERGEALLRLREGRRATIEFEEEGRKFGLVAFRQPSGEVAVQLSELISTSAGEQQTLLDTLVFPTESQSHSSTEARATLRRGDLFDVELVRDSGGMFRAKRASFEISPQPGGDEQYPRECCITCNGVIYCACAVETVCGSCCVFFCCNWQ